jgi:hypothetical protein
LDLKGPGGGLLVPVDITSVADVRAATIYGEVGPNADSLPSGVTFEFLGTGGDVCAFVDPELVFWNQSVSQLAPVRQFRFPDNPYDDGDLDLRAGLSVYYRGTPGASMGGFEVQYTDDLGNDVEVSLVSCIQESDYDDNLEPYAGRGTPEYCTIRNTQPGVSYTVALEAVSLPRDDGRLSFGIVLANGECDGSPSALIPTVTDQGLSDQPVHQECVVVGEALPPLPEGQGAHLYYGYEDGRSYEGSEQFEELFCTDEVFAFCQEEFRTLRDAGSSCDYTGVDGDPARRCFCGDRDETPNPGARR